jgi:hypothetical protein
MIFSSRYCEH